MLTKPFQVLQEVAAARHVLIKCSSTEIDGYAFCSGLSALKLSYKTCPDLQGLIQSVVYLIRGAVFRPRYRPSQSSRFSLGIRPLGELLDMYHTSKATEPHDKVYALLGMASDDPNAAGLSADYETSWKEVFRKVVNFCLSDQMSVDTWDNEKLAVIKGKGCVLGKVMEVQRDPIRIERQNINILWTRHVPEEARSARWSLQTSAKSVENGDIVCLLEGTSRPTIIRPRTDYSTVIAIAASLPDDPRSTSTQWLEHLRSITVFLDDFLLVWDWDVSQDKSQCTEDYDSSMSSRGLLKHPEAGLQSDLDKAIRSQTMGLLLRNVRAHQDVREYFVKAMALFERALGSMRVAYPGYASQVNTDTESLATMMGFLSKEEPMWVLVLAAETRCEATAKLLLDSGKIDLDAKDEDEQTPLGLLVKLGHVAIAKLLVDTGEVDLDARDRSGETPLMLAAKTGYDTIVKLLLGTGKVDLNTADSLGRTPLFYAAMWGHDVIVKLLLDTDQFYLNARDSFGQTPLFLAAISGYDTIVKLLLDTGKVDLNARDFWREKALQVT